MADMDVFPFASEEINQQLQPARRLPALFDRQRIRGKPDAKREPKPIVLQERDCRILEVIWRYKNRLDTYTLAKLVGYTGSDRVWRRRLHALWLGEFVERNTASLVLRMTGIENHVVLSVGRHGYEVLAPRLGLPLDNYQARRQRQFAQEAHWLFLSHRLGLNRFRATLELATTTHEHLKLLSWTEEGLNVTIKNIPERQLRLFRGEAPEKSLRLVPDSLCCVEHTQEAPGRNRSFYYVEYDNGTSPLTARFLTKKALAYAEFHRQNLSSRLRGFRDFNVLLVTTTPTRAQNMRRAFTQWLDDAQRCGQTYPPDLWWFCHKGMYNVDQPETILGPIWQTAMSDGLHSLLE